MKIEDLHASPVVLRKLLKKHRVGISEVFELFWGDQGKPIIRSSKRSSRIYVAYGRTEAGRYLLVAFKLLNTTARIITAREMTDGERKLYGKKR